MKCLNVRHNYINRIHLSVRHKSNNTNYYDPLELGADDNENVSVVEQIENRPEKP